VQHVCRLPGRFALFKDSKVVAPTLASRRFGLAAVCTDKDSKLMICP
jgi:hypothetical protein